MRHPGIRPVRAFLWRARSAQSTVEYVLYTTVIGIALWAAAQYFVPDFSAGLEAMQTDIDGYVSDGVVE